MSLQESIGEGDGSRRRKVIVVVEGLEWNSRERAVQVGTGRKPQRRGRRAQVCLLCIGDNNAEGVVSVSQEAPRAMVGIVLSQWWGLVLSRA